MARAARSLLAAAGRTSADDENRLTELLAVALTEHVPFAHLVFAEAKLDLPAAAGLEFEVQTQRPVANGIVDLEAAAWGENGVVARLWCEVKKDAPFGHRQLERYAESLPAGHCRLVAVVRARDLPGARAHCRRANAIPISWERLGAIGADALASAGRSRSERPRSDEPARQRLLSDFLDYLETELDVVTEPLTTAQACALRDAESALNAATMLFDEGIERSAYKKVPGMEWKTRPGGLLLHSCHLTRRDSDGHEPWTDGWFELFRSRFDYLVGEPPEDEAFHVGITMDRDPYEKLMEPEFEHWRADVRFPATLGGSGFRVFRRGQWQQVVRPLFLVELATRGITLDDQAQYLGDWIDSSLAFVASHPPPQVESGTGGSG